MIVTIKTIEGTLIRTEARAVALRHIVEGHDVPVNKRQQGVAIVEFEPDDILSLPIYRIQDAAEVLCESKMCADLSHFVVPEAEFDEELMRQGQAEKDAAMAKARAEGEAIAADRDKETDDTTFTIVE